MGSEVSTRPKRRKSTIAAASVAGVIVVLFVAGLAFANSVGASRVADNARTLHWANAALGTSSLTRAALAQATTFVELHSQGLATQEDVDFAIVSGVSNHKHSWLDLEVNRKVLGYEPEDGTAFPKIKS